MSQSVWPMSIPLSHPIEAHGETLRTLTLREPTLGILDDVEITIPEKGGVRLNLGDIHRVVAGMAGIPPGVARTIRLADLAPVTRELTSFFSPSPPDGES